MTEFEGLSRRPVYMDHHATTPVDPRVLEAMLPYFTDVFGNAASIDHVYGAEAKRAVDKAREQIANVINAKPSEIIFTSGATESDNLALIGVAEKYVDKGKHIITCQTEHKAVLDTCKHLESRSWKVTYIPVDSQGLIDPDDIRRAITSETVLISIMAANNEIGVLTPLTEIGHIAREHGVFFHTDAAQALGYIPIDVEAMGIDLVSIASHKVYGPKGVGALFVRSSRPRVLVSAGIHGGGHERNMRSGTLNVTGIVGFGRAIEIAGSEMQVHFAYLKELRDELWNRLKAKLPLVERNGHPAYCLPHNLNITIPDIESRVLTLRLKNDIAMSMGSACSSSQVEPSHVIQALGYGPERAHHTIRLGLGRENTRGDVDFVAQRIAEIVQNRVSKIRYR